MKPAFSIPIRVYYEDTDAAGVVYYANYLKFMERARTEWMRALGFEQDELRERHGVVFAVRSATLEFLKPARFNDLLQATAAVKRPGRASITFRQTIERAGMVLCEGEVRIACLDARAFTPQPTPQDIIDRMEEAKAQ
jgi:acyl-CoA thioester hydrolase